MTQLIFITSFTNLIALDESKSKITHKVKITHNAWYVCIKLNSSFFLSLISEICRFKHLHLLNLLEKNHHDVRLKNTLLYLG